MQYKMYIIEVPNIAGTLNTLAVCPRTEEKRYFGFAPRCFMSS